MNMKSAPPPKLSTLWTWLSITGVFIAGMIFSHFHREYTGDIMIVTLSLTFIYMYFAFSAAFRKAREITRNPK